MSLSTTVSNHPLVRKRKQYDTSQGIYNQYSVHLTGNGFNTFTFLLADVNLLADENLLADVNHTHRMQSIQEVRYSGTPGVKYPPYTITVEEKHVIEWEIEQFCGTGPYNSNPDQYYDVEFRALGTITSRGGNSRGTPFLAEHDPSPTGFNSRWNTSIAEHDPFSEPFTEYVVLQADDPSHITIIDQYGQKELLLENILVSNSRPDEPYRDTCNTDVESIRTIQRKHPWLQRLYLI
jgi:hypothetical protein